MLVALGALACGPLVFWSPQGQRALPALGIATILLMLFWKSPGWAAPALLVYLSGMGGMRRWLIPAFGWSGSDPFLLVGPLVAFIYVANRLLSRQLTRDTPLARLLPWLLLMMFLQIFNPLQGGLAVGLAGVLFTMVPILWYYVGRSVGREDVLTRVIRAVTWIAVVAAGYGLYQTFAGFLPSEIEWAKLNEESYGALHVTFTQIRAFSFFTSAQEYAQFLTFGVVIAWAAFLRGNRLALLPIPLLAYAIFLESSRGAVVISLVACAFLWAVQGRSVVAWMPRLALALVLAAAGLAWSLTQVQQQSLDKNTQALVEHQVSGLLNPTEKKSSTAQGHLSSIWQGLLQGFKVPVGRGLGSTTIAAKFKSEGTSDAAATGTEVDLSDCFAGLGFAGGFLYLAVVIRILTEAVNHWRAERSFLSLSLLGLLIAHLGHWLHGGSYAAAMLIWFCIGAIDRAQRLRAVKTLSAPPNAVPEAA